MVTGHSQFVTHPECTKAPLRLGYRILCLALAQMR